MEPVSAFAAYQAAAAAAKSNNKNKNPKSKQLQKGTAPKFRLPLNKPKSDKKQKESRKVSLSCFIVYTV